jgi:hypothetical protein
MKMSDSGGMRFLWDRVFQLSKQVEDLKEENEKLKREKEDERAIYNSELVRLKRQIEEGG